MKKLSILVALILCITIGGVYAVWTYAGSTDVVDSNAEIKVVLEQAKLDGSIGVFTAKSNLVLSIDQADSNHNAGLVFSSNDNEAIYLTFTFAPSASADQTVKDGGIPAEIYQTTTTAMQYPMDSDGNYSATGTPTPVFEFTNKSDGIFTPNVTWTKQSDGSFSVTFNETQLKDMIRLSTTFQLDTKTEYDEFSKILTGNIKIIITDGTVNESVSG